MDRADFLRLVGVGAGAAVLGSCLQACSKQQTTPDLSVDFNLDLTQAANSALNTNGGYLVTQGVIVARTLGGSYLAVAAACTHQGQTLDYQASAHRFHCSRHGATFSESGSVTAGPASSNLQQMNVSLSGSVLHVKS